MNVDERFTLDSQENIGSTLIVTLAKEEDIGDYECIVSSNPPATLKHTVSIIVPPRVTITRPEDPNAVLDAGEVVIEDEIRLRAGDDLSLFCRGTGDPEPVITWTRERKRMPDGNSFIRGGRIYYGNVTRKHSGHYVCEGDNGPGRTARDSIKVNVLHAPEIITEERYVQKDSNSVQLELSCLVHASPRASVTWYNDGEALVPLTNSRPMAAVTERLSVGHSGRKHVLVVSPVRDAEDRGRYTCHAVNDLGDAKGNIQVMGE